MSSWGGQRHCWNPSECSNAPCVDLTLLRVLSYASWVGSGDAALSGSKLKTPMPKQVEGKVRRGWKPMCSAVAPVSAFWTCTPCFQLGIRGFVSLRPSTTLTGLASSSSVSERDGITTAAEHCRRRTVACTSHCETDKKDFTMLYLSSHKWKQNALYRSAEENSAIGLLQFNIPHLFVAACYGKWVRHCLSFSPQPKSKGTLSWHQKETRTHSTSSGFVTFKKGGIWGYFRHT